VRCASVVVPTSTRTTGEGGFEIYPTGAGSKDVGNKRIFPRRSSGTADRTIWIHCEARSAVGKQGLRFVLKNEPEDTRLGSEKRIVESPHWAPVDIYLHIDPSLEFFLRIDHEEVSRVPSELQIRGIEIRCLFLVAGSPLHKIGCDGRFIVGNVAPEAGSRCSCKGECPGA